MVGERVLPLSARTPEGDPRVDEVQTGIGHRLGTPGQQEVRRGDGLIEIDSGLQGRWSGRRVYTFQCRLNPGQDAIWGRRRHRGAYRYADILQQSNGLAEALSAASLVTPECNRRLR